MLYPVVQCECGNKKVADPRGKPLEQILRQKWCTICRKGDAGEHCLMMNLDGMNEVIFSLFLIMMIYEFIVLRLELLIWFILYTISIL